MRIENDAIVDETGVDLPLKFKSQADLKDPKYKLYAWISDRSGVEWDVKIGMAHNETVLKRTLAITGSNAENRVVGLWETDCKDGIVHQKLKSLDKVSSAYRHANDGQRGGTSSEVYKFSSLAGLREILKIVDDVVGAKHVEKANVPLFPDIKRLVDEIAADPSEKFTLDLCTRWGKTRTALELMKANASKLGTKLSVMLSYVGTAKRSYAEELGTNLQYDSFELIDPDVLASPAECLAKIKHAFNSGKHVLYYFALTGTGGLDESDSNDKTCFAKRLAPLLKLDATVDVYVDEADFGADTKRQIAKIHKVWKSCKCMKFYGMTGTDAGCVKSMWPDDKLAVYKRDYIVDVLKADERAGAVSIAWHVLDNSSLAAAVGSNAAMENFSWMCEVVDGHLKEEVYFTQLLRWLYLNETPFDPSKFRDIAKAKLVDPSFATMVFLPNDKKCHAVFAKLVEQAVPGSRAVIVNGDETTNAEAEEMVKQALKDNAKRRGLEDNDFRRGAGVFIIASCMANRSFSVKEIKNILLLVNSGEYWSIAQKVARGLTPFRADTNSPFSPSDPRKICNVIDFRLMWNWPALSNWLSGLGIEVLKQEDHTTETSPFEMVERISEMTGKISFDEYRWNGIDPVHKLGKADLMAMMQTSDFKRERMLKLADLSELPDPARCELDEEIVLAALETNNVLGDSGKHNKVKLTRSANSTHNASQQNPESGAEDEEDKADWKLQHLNFIWNHTDWFSSPGAKTLDESLAMMSAERKAEYEHQFGIDMSFIEKLAKHLKEKDFVLEFSEV